MSGCGWKKWERAHPERALCPGTTELVLRLSEAKQKESCRTGLTLSAVEGEEGAARNMLFR
jgi:hypothetical protein